MMNRQTLEIDLKDAWLGLRRRRVRSILSGLGITIGVVALVAMLSISEGAKRKELRRIASLGADTIRVENALDRAQTENSSSIVNLSQGLTRRDIQTLRIAQGASAVIAPFLRQDEAAAEFERQNSATTVLGIDANWFAAEQIGVEKGRLLLPQHVTQSSQVCVAGAELMRKLHAGVGSVIRVQGEPCEVIGILARKGRLLTEGTGLAALDFDTLVAMPWTSFPFKRAVGGEAVLDGATIALKNAPESTVIATANRIDRRLQQLHRGVRDYQLVAPVSLLKKARETHSLFALVMGSIAGLSLLVGGIGVMNAMLANISEQTREIGLRMAVGATPRRITALYLWHSVLLSVSGGVIGLLLGVIIAWLVQAWAGWEVALAGPGLIIGPAAAIFTGLVSGLYPAMRAAQMRPALALRKE